MPLLTKGKTNWKYILIVLILAVIVGGGILSYLNYFKKEIISISQVFKIKKPEKVVGETANWKTYRKEEYGFEIKYPSNFDIKVDIEGVEGREEGKHLTFCGREYAEYCGDIRSATYHSAIYFEKLRKDGKYKRLYSFVFEGSKEGPGDYDSFDDFWAFDYWPFGAAFGSDPNNLNCKIISITVDGKPGKLWDCRTSLFVFWESDKNDPFFYNMHIYSLDRFPKLKDIFNQMLSTFKFLELKHIFNQRKPYIKVIFPNGGERLEFYGMNEIKWESQGVDAVNIILIDESTGWECERRKYYIPSDLGRIDWEPIEVVCDPGDRFKIKIISLDGKISDESDGYFSMIEGDIQKYRERKGHTQEEGIIKVIWPKGGEILERGKTYPFEFFCGEIPERIPITYIVLVKEFNEYCLEKSGLSSCSMNLGNIGSVNGIFCEPGQTVVTEWNIPLDVPPGEKVFKISISGGGPKRFFISYSDDYFSIF